MNRKGKAFYRTHEGAVDHPMKEIIFGTLALAAFFCLFTAYMTVTIKHPWRHRTWAVSITTFSYIWCWVITPRGRYLMDLPRTLGRHRIWMYALMLPAWPCMLISWRRMRQQRKKDEDQRIDMSMILAVHVLEFKEISLEQRFPTKAMEKIAQYCRRQAELSQFEMTEEQARKIAKTIKAMPLVKRVLFTDDSVGIVMNADCKVPDATGEISYRIGEYCLILQADGMSFSLRRSFSYALANEKRGSDRMDKHVLDYFNCHRNELMRWLYLGRIDILVLQTAKMINSPECFVECDKLDMSERYVKL